MLVPRQQSANDMAAEDKERMSLWDDEERAKAAAADEKRRSHPFFQVTLFRSTDSSALSAKQGWTPFPRELHHPTPWVSPVYVSAGRYLLAVASDGSAVTKLLELSRLGSMMGSVSKQPYTWEGVDPMNCDRSGQFTLCAVPPQDTTGTGSGASSSGGEVYCFGGLAVDPESKAKTKARVLTDRAECFEWTTRAWKEMPPLPKRFDHLQSCYCPANGCIYLYSPLTGDFISFDTAKSTYRLSAAPLVPDVPLDEHGVGSVHTRRDAGFVCWKNRRGQSFILLIGGRHVSTRHTISVNGQRVNRVRHNYRDETSFSTLCYSIDEHRWTEWSDEWRLLNTYSPNNLPAEYVVTSDNKIWVFWPRHRPVGRRPHYNPGVAYRKPDLIEYFCPYLERWCGVVSQNLDPEPDAAALAKPGAVQKHGGLLSIPPEAIDNAQFDILLIST